MRRLGIMLLLVLVGCGNTAPPQPGPGNWRFAFQRPPFPWSVTLKQGPPLEAKPGQQWALEYTVEADLRAHHERYGAFTHLIVAVLGQPRHDAEGYYNPGTYSVAVTSNFTTTGMPVEHFDGWPRLRSLHGRDGSPFEAVQEHALPSEIAARHRFGGRLQATLPADTPAGYYQPRILVFVRVKDVPHPVLLDNFADNSNTQDEKLLPLVKVGAPANPRLPWAILGDYFYRGQAGVLPEQASGRVALCGRSGFPRRLILPPDKYLIRPTLPTVFPRDAVPPVDGGLEVFPVQVPSYLRWDVGQVSAGVSGPGGKQDLGTRAIVGLQQPGPRLQGGAFDVDLRKTGEYRVQLVGQMQDRFGRTFEAGGTYPVTIALPLSFSTSCKPGTSFLVGGAYPAKVNVNPPFPAEVEVQVEYYPNSEVERKKTWTVRGAASRFGHYLPLDAEPLVFDEPGEYLSRASARYTDAAGRLWYGEQTSAGVVAPVSERTVVLHGTRSVPYDLKVEQDYYGAVKRFADRQDPTTSFLPFSPAPLPDPFAPYDPRDSLLVPSNGFNESIIEPQLSIAISDAEFRSRFQQAHRLASDLPPPLLQYRQDHWTYLRDVVRISADTAGWFPADEKHSDELPAAPVGDGQYHPFAFPKGNRVQAYTYLGVVRPGFPAFTSVFQSEALGLYWLASPNRFGYHYNTGRNGDLHGDHYRLQAGVVLKDRESGKNHYDAYGAAISVVRSNGAAAAIVAPGEQPLVRTADREHRIFLGIDTHDAVEVGETMSFGGMVFPAVQADVRWTVHKPGGETIEVAGTANRLGIVGGQPRVPVDVPGIYTVGVQVQHGELRGDVVGTARGAYWHCAVPQDNPQVLQTTAPGMQRVDPLHGLAIPLSWPKALRNATLHWGVMMPGQVLDQGLVRPAGGQHEYRFNPSQVAVQFPNLDVRDYGSGEWALADTVVFQFFLQAEDTQGQPVYDALRFVLRKDILHNYRALMAKPGVSGSGLPVGGQHPVHH